MEPIIHIGYPKTGTTWFQRVYFPYVQNATYVSRRETVEAFVRPNSLEFNSNVVRDTYKKLYSGKLIFSLEGLSGTTHNFGLNGYLTKEHAIRLKDTFPEAKIILFIRSQFDMIASAYMQYIKGGGTQSLKKYIYHKNFRNINCLTMFSFKHYEYHNIIELYHKLFGKENVHVFLYEDFSENNKSFLVNFSDVFGFQINLDNINYTKVNRSYRWFIRYIALVTNRFTEKKMLNKYYILHIPRWFEFSKRVLNYMNHFKIFGKYLTSRDILKEKYYNYINEYYKHSNHILVKKYNLTNITEYNYPF